MHSYKLHFGGKEKVSKNVRQVWIHMNNCKYFKSKSLQSVNSVALHTHAYSLLSVHII